LRDVFPGNVMGFKAVVLAGLTMNNPEGVVVPRRIYCSFANSFGLPERIWVTVSTLSLQNLHLSIVISLKIFYSPFVRKPSSCAARIILPLS